MAGDKQNNPTRLGQDALTSRQAANPMRLVLALAAAGVLGIVAWRVSSRDQPQPDSGFAAHEAPVRHDDAIGNANRGRATPLTPPSLSDGHFVPDALVLVIIMEKEYPDLGPATGGLATSVTGQMAKLDMDQDRDVTHHEHGKLSAATQVSAASADAGVVFSDDGLHQARTIAATQPSGAVAAVIVDGIEGHPVNGPITDLQFSPDGQHYAFLAHTGSNGQMSLFVDGIELKPSLAGTCHGLRYISDTTLRIALSSPDGKLRLMKLRLGPNPVQKGRGGEWERRRIGE